MVGSQLWLEQQPPATLSFVAGRDEQPVEIVIFRVPHRAVADRLDLPSYVVARFFKRI